MSLYQYQSIGPYSDGRQQCFSGEPGAFASYGQRQVGYMACDMIIARAERDRSM